jgi:hypothetical protein
MQMICFQILAAEIKLRLWFTWYNRCFKAFFNWSIRRTLYFDWSMKCIEAFVASSGPQPKSKQILSLTATCKQNAAILASDTWKFCAKICLRESFEGLEQDEKDHNVCKICQDLLQDLQQSCSKLLLGCINITYILLILSSVRIIYFYFYIQIEKI